MSEDAPSKKSLQERWGPALSQGYVVLPTVMLRYMYQLEISSQEAVVLLNLMQAWRGGDHMPLPRTSTLAKRMDLKVRTVERHLASLEEKRLIRRVLGRRMAHGGREQTRYSIGGLIERLKELGIEYDPNREQKE